MDNATQKKINDLELQLAELSAKIEGIENQTKEDFKANRYESVFAHLYKPISFDFIQKLFVKLPNPESLKQTLSPKFIEKKQTKLKNVAIELLKNMPSIRVANLMRGRQMNLDISNKARFDAVDLEKVLEEQRGMLRQMLKEQKEKIKKEANKPKREIGNKSNSKIRQNQRKRN